MKLPFIAFFLSLSFLAPSVKPALAQTAPQPGTLIVTASNPAVYWYSNARRQRYVFPNLNTFYTWFGPSDFYRVNRISDADMAMLRIGGTLTYRPGSRLVKITTDPKVYVVEATSTIRWIESEPVAAAMYGPHWQQFIDDVPDAFFTGYTIGAPISHPRDYRPSATFTPDDILR